jgi:GT2 family glycosyltransferase/glycosyltransferase involved in cell wall biosynthesis
MRALSLEEVIRAIFDADWYVRRYPDVAASPADPLDHFLRYGLYEGRDPNRFFDTAWYVRTYPDVASSGMPPLLHYLRFGAAELRHPHPHFDATFYVFHHPEAAANPLFYHVTHGVRLGYATERGFSLAAHLPVRDNALPPPPSGVEVDVIIPVYRGLEETRRCLESVLAAPSPLLGEIIVIDDHTPEPALGALLEQYHAAGRIRLIRPARRLGFVAASNRGIMAAGRRDVILLNNDTEVPPGWIDRLAAHAYATPRVASVSPLSNNATICSYPTLEGGPLAFGLDYRTIDAETARVHAGRSAETPVTGGFCMYIRRAALDEVGLFDAETFGLGYGEEVDFCLRAGQRGFRHLLACDVFVYHAGGVSFGRQRGRREEGMRRASGRHPELQRLLELHRRYNTADPARFALTAALFRRLGRPAILLISHDLGGGVGRHERDLATSLGEAVNLLTLRPASGGVRLEVTALPGHPTLYVPASQLDELARLLRDFALVRVHVQHLMRYYDADILGFVFRLGLPFDVTLHDYYPLCPQVNLLPWRDGGHCGEPETAACNDCILVNPAHGAFDILEWRLRHRWLFRFAERVLCPSHDAEARLARHGLAERAVLAPHESGTPPPPEPRRPARGRPLRVGLIGTLAPHKGWGSVLGLARLAGETEIALHLIGAPETPFPPELEGRITASGAYEEEDLPRLLAEARLHVAWFPAEWPETWSYTLSAALAAGLPIVASRIGVFPERLAGRPWTWLVAPDASPEHWRRVFAEVRQALERRSPPPPPALSAARTSPPSSFYPERYLASLSPPPAGKRLPRDLRIPGRRVVLVSPCAYIRLLLPLTHPDIAGEVEIFSISCDQAELFIADAVFTHRYAIPDRRKARRLLSHCRKHGMPLFYDLDDDLLGLPKDHPEAPLLEAKRSLVAEMARGCDRLTLSTPELARRFAAEADKSVILPNGLDERLWEAVVARHAPASASPPLAGPIRLLVMGTRTHRHDFALIAGVCSRLLETFGERITIDVCGMTDMPLPAGVGALSPVPGRAESYPGFIAWLARQIPWHIGLAPLAASPFNAAKSPLKLFDYAALGLAIVASDVEPYRGCLADGKTGLLVANDEAAWFEAIAHLIRHPRRIAELAVAARAELYAPNTLAARASVWREACTSLFSPVLSS